MNQQLEYLIQFCDSVTAESIPEQYSFELCLDVAHALENAGMTKRQSKTCAAAMSFKITSTIDNSEYARLKDSVCRMVVNLYTAFSSHGFSDSDFEMIASQIDISLS